MSDPAVLEGLVQPDARSCGAACLVAVDALADPAYAARLRTRPGLWRAEVLGTHAAVTALRDGGRWSAPWPRALGTPPWAVARRLRVRTGQGRHTRWGTDLTPVRTAVRAGTTAPLYVGTRLLPRHVLLATATGPDGALTVYDPARGSIRPLADALRTGWPVVWCAVLPRSS